MSPSILNRSRGFLFVGLAAFCLGGAIPDHALPSRDARVTAESVLRSKHLGHYGKVRASTLLEFVSREDSRPWYVDDALLLLELRDGRWVLVHAVRNPKPPSKAQARSMDWLLHHVMDAPHVGDRFFDHRPGRVDLERFLKDNDWPFGSTQGWRVVGRLRDPDVWQRTLGFKPDELRRP